MPVIIAFAVITFAGCLAIGFAQIHERKRRAEKEKPKAFDLHAHLVRQMAFSTEAFGPRYDPAALLDHLRGELEEIELEPQRLEEWIDVLILALDGAWRCGHSPEEICAALAAKQIVNENRRWPDWRKATPGKAIEHIRAPGEGPKIRRN